MRLLLRATFCLVLVAVTLSAQSGTDVLFHTDRGTKGELPQYLADLMEQLTAQELHRLRPCTRETSESAVGATLGWEKMKDLLGAGDDGAIERIGGALGAKTIGSISVSQIGDQILVTFSTLDTKSATTTSRSQTTLSAKDLDSAWDKLQDFAKQRAKEMVGQMRACPEPKPASPEPDDSEKRRQQQEQEERIRMGHAEGRVDEYGATIK